MVFTIIYCFPDFENNFFGPIGSQWSQWSFTADAFLIITVDNVYKVESIGVLSLLSSHD